jgi:hypothetical protein
MWTRFFGTILGLGLMSAGLWFAVSRKPRYLTVERTGIDGVKTVTEEYRTLRLGGRLLMLGLAVVGFYMLITSGAPASLLATRMKTAVNWLVPVAVTTGVSVGFVAAAAWLLYRRVLGFTKAPAPLSPAVVSVEHVDEEADFVQDALAGEAVEEGFNRGVRAMARHRIGALILSIALLGAAWYLVTKVPAAWNGDYDKACRSSLRGKWSSAPPKRLSSC